MWHCLHARRGAPVALYAGRWETARGSATRERATMVAPACLINTSPRNLLMIRLSELKLPLADVPTEHRRAADAPTETRADCAPPPHPVAALTRLAALALGVGEEAIAELHVFKRSFDARKAELLAVYTVDVTLADPAHEPALLAAASLNPHIQATPDMAWHRPGQAPAAWPADESERPVVVGLGPCGLFAALALAQMGFRPIVIERGKPVRERTKDTWALWRGKGLNPQSNVQYGEGGAGLFSDGKLYSQIKDPRFLGRQVMQAFVDAGAPVEILYMAHPHIGTFKLVRVVEAMREKIVALGGEIRFQQQVVGVRLTAADADGQQQLTGLRVLHLPTGETQALPARRAVFALGHSARDGFAMLFDAGVLIDTGVTEVECVVVEMSEEKEKALNIALNKISGEWDKEKLSLLISDL